MAPAKEGAQSLRAGFNLNLGIVHEAIRRINAH
jgi:hypothetical protein